MELLRKTSKKKMSKRMAALLLSIMVLANSMVVFSARGGNYVMRRGIDVSHHQGANINWQEVRNSGVEFAFIRVGARRLGSGELYEDNYYQQNIERALQAGIKVGVYVYSQAITVAEAQEEADFLLGRIYKYNITLPVVIDYEYGGSGTRLVSANLSNQTRTDICNAFCKRVTDAGYTGMVYANASMLKNDLYANQIENNYRIWMAHYTAASWYAGIYDFWQYGSNGSVPGISGAVDVDYWYDDGTIQGMDYSSVFDATYYADHNSDIKAIYGYDTAALLQHFISSGMKEGRQACATFSVKSYRNANQDLRVTFGTDYESYFHHYMRTGKNENRITTGYDYVIKDPCVVWDGVDYSDVYNYNDYMAYNTDLVQYFGTDDVAALQHFINSGMSEARQAKTTFSVKSYRNANSDLRGFFGKDYKKYFQHYMTSGKNEGRVTTGYDYKIRSGVTVYKGTDYSLVYDYDDYMRYNPDLKSYFGDDDEGALAHFVNSGMSEARQAKATFSVKSYREMNEDLNQQYGDAWEQYYMHYLKCGYKEGRRVNN